MSRRATIKQGKLRRDRQAARKRDLRIGMMMEQANQAADGKRLLDAMPKIPRKLNAKPMMVPQTFEDFGFSAEEAKKLCETVAPRKDFYVIDPKAELGQDVQSLVRSIRD